MNHGKILILIMTLLLSGLSSASGSSSQFKVALKGSFNYLESFQKRAELKLARSTDFCRGFTLPTRVSKWSCKRIGGGEGRCSAQFKCGLVRRGFSRKSETVRLTKEIRALSQPKKKFSLIISKRAYKKFNYNKYARQAQRIKTEKMLAAKAKRDAALKEQVRLRARRLKTEMTEMDEFSQLEQELNVATKKEKKELKAAEKKVDTIEELEEQAIAADKEEIKSKDEMNDLFGEDKELAKLESEESTGLKDSAETKSDDKSDSADSSNEKSNWHFLSFGVGAYSISDSEGNGVKTFGLLWSPLWKISSSWGLKGNVSWHPYNATVDPAVGAESFSIMEYGAQLEWHPMSGGLYLSAGYGTQSWGSSIKGSFSAISLGGGYYFEEKKGRIIDYIFVKQTSVSNATKNSELVGGIGFIF